MERAQGLVAEQIIRPTGLVDPVIEVRPVQSQMDDLMAECGARAARDERVLVTTLTKRMAEDLTEYFRSMGVQARYLHSDIDTLERMALINALRKKEFDVLVGINLLREGLDIPEVSLVAILDADKEGFLRSAGSLIQTFGRAARNSKGRVIMYADGVTASMRAAMEETERRREKQIGYNAEHGIIPTTIRKDVNTPFDSLFAPGSPGGGRKRGRVKQESMRRQPETASASPEDIGTLIQKLEREMRDAARELEFEHAAALRDRIRALREQLLRV
jgi:excinuclease ABC subunit B